MKRITAVASALILPIAIAACGAVVPPEPRVLTVPGLRGTDLELEVLDTTGDVIDARAVRRADLGVEGNALDGQTPVLAKRGAAPNEVRIVWLSSACAMSARMTVSRPNKVTIVHGPMEDCDAIFNYRAVILAFRDPVEPAAVELELQGIG